MLGSCWGEAMNKNLKRNTVVILTLFSLCFYPVKSFASDIRYVEASSLNVRSKPNTSSNVLGSLNKGELVIVIGSSAGWAKIGYYVSGTEDFRIGWVASKFLSAVTADTSNNYGYDDDEMSVSDANYSLNIDDVDFKCREALFDNGFEKCDIGVALSFTSNYSGNETPKVDFSCDVELGLTDNKGWSTKKYDSASGTAWMHYSSGSEHVDMSVRVAGLFDPIVSAKIKDLSCKIDHVW